MKITVQRSGGVAGMTRLWTVQAISTDDKERWMPIVEACPWDEVPNTIPSRTTAATDPDGRTKMTRPPVPADHFVYSIRAGQRRAALPEQAVTGPWRVLVDCAKSEGEASRPGGR